MSKITKNLSLVALPIMVMLTNASAYGAGKGATPSGKPFVELNGYIHEIEGEVSSIQDQIDSLVATVDTIEDRVGANETAIADLEATNATLQSQIDANAADIATVEGQITDLEAANADLQGQIDALGGTDAALQQQIDSNEALITAYKLSIDTLGGNLQAQITNNLTLIGVLQAEIIEINEQLALRQMIISGNCPPGESIREVSPEGQVVCEVDDAGAGGAGTLTAYTVYVVTGYASPGGLVWGWPTCPADTVLTGGGFWTRTLTIHRSHPSFSGAPPRPSGNYWNIAFRNDTNSADFGIAYASCLKLAP